MIITENTNLNAVLQVTDADGNTKSVMAINSSLIKDGDNFNLSIRNIDNTILESNLVEIQTQIDNFMETLRLKMVELNYKITI